MQPFSFFFCWLFVGGGISGRVRVGSDNLGYGPGSGFSFEPVQTSNAYHTLRTAGIVYNVTKYFYFR